MTRLKHLMMIAPAVWLLAGCGENLNEQERNTNNRLGQKIEFSMNGIEAMNGQHYEGWLVTDQGVVSTGRFNIDSFGETQLVDSDGQAIRKISDNGITSFDFNTSSLDVSTFVLTIEPNGDTDDGPSDIHYVAGDFVNGEANATIDASAAINATFVRSLGEYILATPTNGAATHNQGVWYLNNGNPSLQLPALNTGWIYEGWIVDTTTGTVISTGTFSGASGADSDGPGATAGPNPAPAFPGQDFINPARILDDGQHTLVISVEPHPDADPAPFTLKILAHDIPLNLPVVTPTALNNISNESDISIKVRIE